MVHSQQFKHNKRDMLGIGQFKSPSTSRTVIMRLVRESKLRLGRSRWKKDPLLIIVSPHQVINLHQERSRSREDRASDCQLQTPYQPVKLLLLHLPSLQLLLSPSLRLFSLLPSSTSLRMRKKSLQLKSKSLLLNLVSSRSLLEQSRWTLSLRGLPRV